MGPAHIVRHRIGWASENKEINLCIKLLIDVKITNLDICAKKA